MSDSQYYDQCYWHADGSLKCQRHKFTYDPQKYKNYTEFNSFSKPNQNYKPNAYRENKEYYEQPYQYNSGVDRNVPVNEYNCNKQWLAPPQTKTRTDYFKYVDSPWNPQWSN